MRYRQNVNMNVASFVLKVERLGLAIINNDGNEKERLKKSICEMLNCLPTTLDVIKEKEELLNSKPL